MLRLRYYRDRYPDILPAHYRVGTWAWIAHRFTGVGIAGYLIAHIVVIARVLASGASFDQIMATLQRPLFIALDFLLVAAILYHMFNGVRILLFDLGIGLQRQKTLFWGFMAAGAVIFAVSLVLLLPFAMGEPLK